MSKRYPAVKSSGKKASQDISEKVTNLEKLLDVMSDIFFFIRLHFSFPYFWKEFLNKLNHLLEFHIKFSAFF